MKSFLAFLFFAVPFVDARIGSDAQKKITSQGLTYPIKERQLATPHFTLDDLEDYRLTFSDDSPPHILEKFILQLWNTDGALPDSPTLDTVSAALETFLTAELNARYAPIHRIEEIKAKFASQDSVSSGTALGSSLVTQVKVEFDHEPSPDTEEVDLWVQTIMHQLDDLVNNITTLDAGQDPELAGLVSASRLPYVTTSDRGSGDGDGPSGINSPQTGSDEPNINLVAILPTVLGVLLVLSMITTFFVLRRRNHTRIESFRSSHIHRLSNARFSKFGRSMLIEAPSDELEPVNVMAEEESDIFSFEVALIDSPAVGMTPTSKAETAASMTSASKPESTASMASANKPEATAAISTSTSPKIQKTLSITPRSTSGKPPLTPRSKARNAAAKSGSGHRADIPAATDDAVEVESVDLNDDDSDLFDDLNSNMTSPKNGGGDDARSVFSFLSAFTRGSAATVPASNVTRDKNRGFSDAIGASSSLLGKQVESLTPQSRGSSLFAFSEEEEEAALKEEAEKDSSAKSRSDNQDELPFDESIKDPIIMNDSESFEDNGFGRVGVADSSDSSAYGPFIAGTAEAQNAALLQANKSYSSNDYKPDTYSHLFENQTGLGFTRNSSGSSEIKPFMLPINTSQASVGGSVNTSNTGSSNVPSASSVSRVSSSSSSSIVGLSQIPTDSTSVGPEAQQDVNHNADNTRLIPETASLGHNETANRKWGLSSALGKLSQRFRKDDIETSNGGAVDVVPLEHADAIATSAALGGASAAYTGAKTPDNISIGEASSLERSGRRHAKSTTEDGSKTYQSAAMEPSDWSIASGTSHADSQLLEDLDRVVAAASTAAASTASLEGLKRKRQEDSSSITEERRSSFTKSLPAISTSPREDEDTKESVESPSKKLINNLVWLEKKIAAGTEQSSVQGNNSFANLDGEVSAPPATAAIEATDSMSFVSGDVNLSNDSSSLELNSYGSSGRPVKGLHSIVCRDCFAPPGKLKIVIHSTKDGPAVHTVKDGSSLEGHIFPGDLIISVDNIDTRTFSAEQVMKMMTARTRFERKITVLHFEEEGGAHTDDDEDNSADE